MIDEALAEIEKLERSNKLFDEQATVMRHELEKLREALKLVTYADRSRGYPTPKEWDETVSVARAALDETKSKDEVKK